MSAYIGQLGVVVLAVDDLPATTSDRAFIEKTLLLLFHQLIRQLAFQR